MRRREFIAALGSVTAWPLIVRAQTPSPVIGFLSTRSLKDSGKIVAAFGAGLNETGFIIGKTVSVEYRFADGELNRLPELAADLVNKKVTIIAAVGGVQFAAVGAQDESHRLAAAGKRDGTGDPVAGGVKN